MYKHGIEATSPPAHGGAQQEPPKHLDRLEKALVMVITCDKQRDTPALLRWDLLSRKAMNSPDEAQRHACTVDAYPDDRPYLLTSMRRSKTWRAVRAAADEQ